MNACEDQSEPLGEHPEIPARGDAGIGGVLDAINRGAMLGVLAAADAVAATAQLAERQSLAIEKIRELAPQWQFSTPYRQVLAILDEAGV
ncbi:hypothetical protein SEA_IDENTITYCRISIS_44 [Mycobacterium phage IdentityCrisis]|uniref:Uncharacterized protein n=1 Tax=Mycobacterium phage IdentityCrisis TaxID=2599866 RepID=A0A5J6TGI4_9CAUD|nr:hypothetical protein QEH37_gp43 [Mycobacterium phage IdentityCrisis]QFG10063.1 hypothetical protein SEA_IDENTITYCRISIS_44 [Mycobacterium phage IdentityCrisis]